MEWVYAWIILAIWRAEESIVRKDGKKLNVLYIVDRNHQRSVIVVDHSRNFLRHLVDGGNNGEIFIQEEEIIVRNWKKGKLRTKSLSKFKTYIRWTRALRIISRRQNQIIGSLNWSLKLFCIIYCSCHYGSFDVEHGEDISYHELNSWCETDAVGIAP